jgi:hypothetical protein
MILTYNEHRHGGEAIDPEDKWTDHEPEYIDWYPGVIYIDEPLVSAKTKAGTPFVETVSCSDAVKKGDDIFLLVVRYQTGGTFGLTHGCWEIIGAYKTEDEAKKLGAIIEEDDRISKLYERENRFKTIKLEPPPVRQYNGSNRGYLPWVGYFERLEDVEIHRMTVG